MGKILIFSFLWWILGSPFMALLVLLVVLYLLDRRFIGLFPSLTKPWKRTRRLSRLRQELALNPHSVSDRLEKARLLIEARRYKEALEVLDGIRERMADSAEVQALSGLCRLKLGELEQGEADMLEALSLNSRVQYGEPYLRLGEAFAAVDAAKAQSYLEQFREVHSSSCEAYYRLGLLYEQMGNREAGKAAFKEAVDIYRGLPKYKKRTERRWALLSRMKQ